MQINDILNGLAQSELEIAQSYCIINGSMMPLADIEKMGYEEFSQRSKAVIPTKLYKYYPNTWITEQGCKKPINYSLQALINNTVFLQSPDLFDDIYDSDIHIEWKEYANIRLRTYCQRCNCDVNEDTTLEEMSYHLAKALLDAWNSSKDMLTAFVEAPKNEIENLTNQLFSSFVLTELNKGLEWNTAVVYALQREYEDYINNLRRSFRTSCFAMTPYSQLMWGGAYSDCHRGFCIEYNVDPSSPEHQNLFLNLFPIIYCKSRPDMAERIVKAKDEGITTKTLWDIYFHGALRKSFDWAYQNEWRLLLPLGNKEPNYTISFFPISKVFLGNRMDKKDRADVINICREKNIPYIGVTRSANFFEMKDCETLCENCPRYLSK